MHTRHLLAMLAAAIATGTGHAEATIQRSQWGMNWGIDLGVPDVVKLVIQVEAIKQ